MVPTAVEARIRRVLLRHAGEQRLQLSVPQVHELARIAARAAEAGRPKEVVQAGRPKSNEVAGLEQTHLDILRLIASFMTNRDIAEHLALSKDQVDHRVRRLHAAFGTSTRTALVAGGREAGLLGPAQAPEVAPETATDPLKPDGTA